MATLLLVFSFISAIATATSASPGSWNSSSPASSSTVSYVPQDNYLIDCGSGAQTTHSDGRQFLSDQSSGKYFSSQGKDILVSLPSADVPSPLYLSARIFTETATYNFHISRPGWHWVRLHFYPFKTADYNLQDTKFTLTADNLVLLHEFNVGNNTNWFFKEYLINVTTERLPLKFQPVKGAPAFINGIEVVSAPDMLITETGYTLSPVAQFHGIGIQSFETVYRLNVGGPEISSRNDSLGRTWLPDLKYQAPDQMCHNVSVDPSAIKYPQGGSRLIAPQSVYASAVEMANANAVTKNPSFNVTWDLDIDLSYPYLIRLHFCDIVSQSLNDLYFNVFINGKTAISGIDLSALSGDQLATAYYKDFVVNSTMVSTPLRIQVGPWKEGTGAINALLNGIEVLKMNNSVNSLDGEFGADGKKANGGVNKVAVAAVGFAMMFGAFVGLGAVAVKWQKRPHDWQKRNSFSSWLLPLHAGDNSFMNSKNAMGSKKSQFFSSTGLGRYFSFAELSEATKNWDPNAVIGVGGFGNVYIGEIDDGTQVAVKRGNPQSEQGINEFQTEIQMLSKLRHRHLVSLIGYCDENEEMILVYEFMSNGPLRDHLYGKNLPSLSWKQRLEICIGSARGLHYLHTGSAQGIIHRDVKTTNILLDDSFVAKMADFGLSKDGAPNGSGQTHVSTAVKGSFGYLDPEYFRKQQLTDKSDVYSFGVVLLEVLCARPALNPALPREQVNLAEWAMQWKRKGLLEKIMDPSLAGAINPESMNKFAEAAEKCLAEYGVDRPTMGDVLWNLEHALQLQEAFLQGKAAEEDENNNAAVVSQADNKAEGATAGAAVVPPAEVPVIDEHSGTAMFAHFTAINGR